LIVDRAGFHRNRANGVLDDGCVSFMLNLPSVVAGNKGLRLSRVKGAEISEKFSLKV
jgi:hypothetical protein